MKKNIGRVDSILRIALGLGLIVFGFAARSWFGLLGLIPLLTAGIGTCPLYLPFGISTRREGGAAGKGA